MKSDSDIQRDAEAELKWDPHIDASDIAVAVKDGVVTLIGFVLIRTTHSARRSPRFSSTLARPMTRLQSQPQRRTKKLGAF
jgi:hypothetical protein